MPNISGYEAVQRHRLLTCCEQLRLHSPPKLNKASQDEMRRTPTGPPNMTTMTGLFAGEYRNPHLAPLRAGIIKRAYEYMHKKADKRHSQTANPLGRSIPAQASVSSDQSRQRHDEECADIGLLIVAVWRLFLKCATTVVFSRILKQ